VEDKNKLLKPILSRFCEIYVPDHVSTQGKRGPAVHVNLHKVAIERLLGFKKHHDARIVALKRLLTKHGIFPIKKTTDHQTGGDGDVVPTCIELMQLSETIAERGYSALDLIHILEEDTATCEDEDVRFTNYELLMAFNGVKREFRNEKLLILFILYFIVFRSEIDLKNITFI
jgi:hypothetical protein